MTLATIVQSIDYEISRLHQARELSRTTNCSPLPTPAKAAKTTKRKPMSAAARKRIAEAQRARWAAQKKG